MLNELKSRAENNGSNAPLTVAQVRRKFKKCLSECRKTRYSCHSGLATEPSINLSVTSCNDDVDNENQYLDKDYPGTQLFVPAKTASQKGKRKGDKTEILTKAVNLVKKSVENDASNDMAAFLKQDIEKLREHT